MTYKLPNEESFAKTVPELETIIPPEIKNDEFYYLITKLSQDEQISTVLEIGSSTGGGSTEAFVKGLSNNLNHPRLFCMEVSKTRFAELQKCYADRDFVRCYNVSSVPISKFPSETEVSEFYVSTKTALNDYPLERVIGWLRQDIDYVQSAGVPADGIAHIKRENGLNSFDMVLIDGSEFTGKAELDEVYGAKFVLLDDINGFKNFYNRKRLLVDPNYSLFHENLSIRNGYSVFRRNDIGMPIHFFTIVLNGEPFIRHHLEQFLKLPFRWHWHIVEGVAELKYDTAWSLQQGGRITGELHKNGLSNDGTTEYLDALSRKFPDNVTVYRKPAGQFWDGKLEMVNAPLQNITERCLLWQIDVDELWTADKLSAARTLFLNHPEKTAAYYYCHFFVGPHLVTTSRDTYGNHTSYEWLRTWRFEPGQCWVAHEPPRLCIIDGTGQLTDVAETHPFRHAETESNGLTFQHFAYTLATQLRFKEDYYGYHGAVRHWERLQNASRFPVLLRDYFPWVTDNTTVDTAGACGIVPLIKLPDPTTKEKAPSNAPMQKILWVRTDSIGDTILASSMLEHIRKQYPQFLIIAVCQQHIAELYEACPYIDSVIPFDKTRLERDQFYRDIIIRRLQAVNADLALNSVYSREPVTDLLISQCGAREKIALDGDLSNVTLDQKQSGDKGYTKLINTQTGVFPELVRNQEFLRGIGINVKQLAPCVWTTTDDANFAERFFAANNLKQESTIALFPGAQLKIKLYCHFGKALAALCRQKDFTVIGLGSSADVSLAQQELDILGVPVINLCGQVTLRQTAELLKRCRLAVGVDSALAHMSCAVNTPNVIVFGGGHFGRFMPYSPLTSVICFPLECYGCNWNCRYDRPYCIQAILPEVVSSALEESLQHDSDKPRVHVQQGKFLEQIPVKPAYRETSLNFITVPADVYLHKLYM
jgi:ADP-heptose:LPS heptosyltransferase